MRTAAVAAVGLLALAGPATANHKGPITKTYPVSAPVPYAVEGSSHCSDGVEGLTKASIQARLPEPGTFEAALRGYVGDWVLELYDDKGRMIAQAARFDPTNPAPRVALKYKNKDRNKAVTLVACNVTGGPNATVDTVFTYRH